jgi:formylglycine-generating enzyme required for sulfatase activity
VFVTYGNGVRYCRWRSAQEGVAPDAYSLPTEAQWETAARGGKSELAYPWGAGVSAAVCNTLESGRGHTLPVHEGTGNGFGLVHIGSNIREWCRDFYSPSFYRLPDASRPNAEARNDTDLLNMRVVRGASFQDKAAELGRCAARNYAHPSGSCNDIGFRCVRVKG